MTEKAVELGFQPPSRDEINEILRSPSRRRKTISTWAKGDSPRENWLIENVSSWTVTEIIKNYLTSLKIDVTSSFIGSDWNYWRWQQNIRRRGRRVWRRWRRFKMEWYWLCLFDKFSNFHWWGTKVSSIDSVNYIRGFTRVNFFGKILSKTYQTMRPKN